MKNKNSKAAYEDLAGAIVIQAAKDYRGALCALKRNPNNHAAEQMRKETERFFKSGWYTELTDLDGELIMKKIREEVK